jgi:hypothetical protein
LRLQSTQQRLEPQIVGAAQANVQSPPPAPQQLQQVTPRQAETQQRRLVPETALPPARALVDSTRVAFERSRELDSAGRLALEAVVVEKAVSPTLLVGCYEVRPVSGARGTSLLPRAIALDSMVATVPGDTAWYQARSLDVPVASEVELTWRPARGPARSGARSIEIAVRRGQLTEAMTVTILQFQDVVVTGAAGAARSADLRSLSASSPVFSYTANLTSCPRR